MPKRKRADDVNVAKKLRKIEKMLKECKSRRKRIVSSSSEGSSQSLYNHSDGEFQGPSLDSDMDSVLNQFENQQQTETLSPPTVSPPAPLPPSPQPPPLLPASTSQEAAIPSTSQDATIPSTSQEEVPILDASHDPGLDKEILDILGDDPTTVVEYGKDIRPELAARFNYIAVNGLNKETRKELCEKHLLPGNCRLIGAPALNAEVKAAINETVSKRDKLIEYKQKRLAAAISCLGEALSHALEAKDKDNTQIKRLMDTARLLCDAQYNDSVSRRNLAVSSLKKEMKDPLLNTKIDMSLFGENLTESLKTAKAVTKSGTDLKNQFKATPTKNWRAPVAGRRQPATMGRRNTPAAPTTPAAPPAPRTNSEPRTTRTLPSRRPPPPPPRFTRRRY